MKILALHIFLSFFAHWTTFTQNDDPVVISATVVSSGCNGQSSIVVTASGGDGSFNYSIQCDGSPPIFSSSNVFEGVPACTYTVTAYSGVESASTTVTVPPDPPALSLSLATVGCSISSAASGGGGLYQYAISSVSSSGPWGTDQSSGTFSNLTPGVYYVRVTDNCGQAVVKNISVTGLGGMTYSVSNTADEVCLTNVTGGEPPYEYVLVSSSGTYTSTDGCFSKVLLGCNDYTITINGGCGTGTYTGEVPELTASVGCVRFVDGHVELHAQGGTPPYSYTVYAAGNTFTNTTGFFDNLPHPVRQYGFQIMDACGAVESGFGIIAYDLKFLETGSCDSDTLRFMVWRDCQTSYHFDDLVVVTCISCGNVSDTLNYSSEATYFSNAVPGQTQLSIVTGCNDTTFCHDTLVLNLFAGCDSIRARIADLFICDYFEQSIRWMEDAATVYELYAPDGSLLATNNTGLFQNLSPANGYSVKAISPLCGTLTAITDLKPAQNIPLNWTFELSMSQSGGACSPRYALTIPRNQGPMLLTGGPDHIAQLIDDDHVPYNCLYYFPPGLKPGDYQLSSRSFCAIDSFTLPELPFNALATVVSDCPGAGRIQVEGAHNYSYWRDFFESNGLDNWDAEDYRNDSYRLYYADGVLVDYKTEAGGPAGFVNLESGTYALVLTFLYCGVDTAWVTILDQPLLAASISPGVICPGETTGSVLIEINPGREAYRVREINCSTLTYEGGYDSGLIQDTMLIVDQLALGIHCFEISDGCDNKVTQATGVSFFTDEIEVTYQCTPATVQLQIDSLPFFRYIWLDQQGDTLGHYSGQVISYPTNANTISVQVITPGACTIEKSATIQPDITPFVSLTGNTIVCNAGDSILASLQPFRPDYTYEWSDGSTNSVEKWLMTGSYTVTVTHPFSNCTSVSSIQIDQAPVFLPVLGTSAFCEGDSSTITFNNADEFASWIWYPMPDTGTSVIVTDSNSVTLTAIDTLGCSRTASVTPTVFPKPAPVLMGPTEICAGATGVFSTAPDLFAAYQWSNGATSAQINAPAGLYAVTVTSSDGCTGIAPAFLSTEIPLIAVALQVPDHVCKGDTIDAQVSAFSPIYTDGTVEIVHSTGETTVGAITNGMAILPIAPPQNGMFTITSVSLQGYQCPFVLPPGDSVLVSDPSVILEAKTLSGGYHLPCPGDSSAVVTIVQSEGIAPLSFEWSNGAQAVKSITGVSAGSYTVTLTDGWYCTATAIVLVVAPPPLTPFVQVQSPQCFGTDDGLLEISAPASQRLVQCIVNGELVGYLPVWMSLLPPGQYTVELNDAVCPGIDTVVVLTEPPSVSVNIIEEEVSISLGESYKIRTQIEADIPYVGIFSPEAPHNGDYQPEVSPVNNIRYELTVTDTNGCTFADAILIRVVNDGMYWPNVVKPGTPGNDVFFPFDKEGAVEKVVELNIFDRWGNKVFENRHFDPNNAAFGWNGTFQGKAVNPAVFVWTAKVAFTNGEVINYTGDVTVVR